METTEPLVSYYIKSTTGFNSIRRDSYEYALKLVKVLESNNPNNSYQILSSNPYNSSGTVLYTTGDTMPLPYGRLPGDNMPNQYGTYFVFNPGSNSAPKIKHNSEYEARMEAERLAAANPGQQFYVVKAVTVSETPKVVTKPV